VLLVGLLACANAAFHIEEHFTGHADYSTRIAHSIALMMIMLIGGRIVPSFTRNWLARENPGRLPTSFSRFDGLWLLPRWRAERRSAGFAGPNLLRRRRSVCRQFLFTTTLPK
jgi:hypothetical protein